MSTVLRLIRRLAVIAAVLGAVLLPIVDASPAGLLIAVLALVVVSVAVRVIFGVSAPHHLRTRAALRRRIQRPAQSDPDARGHARPRAPGRLVSAV